MSGLSAFYLRYCGLRVRIAPFRMKADFETVKTVAAIDELLNRADLINAGADPGGRFNISAGHTVENYISRACRYIEALERGELPLRGMFAEPGLSLIDHSFIEKDGKMHLFYIRGAIGYEWDTRPQDTFGHAVTDDLINWEILPPCLSTRKGGHDDYQIWAPAVIKKDGLYYMFYTGVNINVAQAICLAASRDLTVWERHPENPVLRPGSWGEWSAERWSDCRDPMVLHDNGAYYIYYCSAKRQNGKKPYPALGIASSEDMISWRDEGAYCFDFCDFALESPFAIKRGELYYLFYTNSGKGTEYAVSDNPVTGWKRLGTLLKKEGVPESRAFVPSCSEVFEFKGQWYISCCERQPGCEQYLEIFKLAWNTDGTAAVGEKLM